MSPTGHNAPAASNGNGRAYQTSTVSSSASNLTANQMAHLAEYDELNMFRDGVFECTDNVYPSCFLSFLCPYVHAGQLARRLQVAPCWLPPLVLFAVFGVVFLIIVVVVVNISIIIIIIASASSACSARLSSSSTSSSQPSGAFTREPSMSVIGAALSLSLFVLVLLLLLVL